ncbi:hypothetical protein FISHEDRAFT_54105 [Fistulina hepatica ATCC 64428]|uniref:Thioesterase domain-containing protein n=1 Tax=Fistulina hepatica ATCC 64428 TaxID=1128425 RepID=A0A0D7A176_9AGAR|nr:hypothetical protein FISHEDRAFT_54105 [Fistulina hepatica ATCC 64428]
MAQIGGNASHEVKKATQGFRAYFLQYTKSDTGFAQSIGKRLSLDEVSINPSAAEPARDECKVVCSMTVEEDMVNGSSNLHGGCSAFLIDVCSSLALVAMSAAMYGEPMLSVSQSLNVVFHSPAALGDKLRIVNTTLTLGARAMSVRTEIWNDTHKRLVCSGVHIKMQPSVKPAAKL